jgi:hypothetical protein
LNRILKEKRVGHVAENKIGVTTFGKKTEPILRRSRRCAAQRMSVMINNWDARQIKCH